MKLEIGTIYVQMIGSEEAKKLERKLDLILTNLQIIKRKEDVIMAALDPIREKVAAMTTVIGSVKALLESLSQMLKDAIAAGASPEEIAAIVADIDAKTAELANAVVANTPAA